MTNGDRIRKMNDEELAEWFAPHMLCRICPKERKIVGCYPCDPIECKIEALKWMKQEEKENA